MPTPPAAFAAVAAALSGGTDPLDAAAVEQFYRRRFTAMPDALRELVAEFLMAQTGTPAPEELAKLAAAVAATQAEHDLAPWGLGFGGTMDAAPAAEPADATPARRRAAL